MAGRFMRGHGNLVVAPDIQRVVHRALYTEVNARQLATALSFRRPITFTPGRGARPEAARRLLGGVDGRGDDGRLMPPRIAVFTKNRSNPAYQAARLGADRAARRLGASTLHYVPERPDDVAEQIALIARAVAARPDAAVFVPVDVTAVNDAILGFDAARIPLLNFITRTTAGRRVCFVGSDDCALAKSIAAHLFAKLSTGAGRSSSSRGRRRPRPAASGAPGFDDALAGCPGHRGPAGAARRLPARGRCAPPFCGRGRPMAGRGRGACAPTT